MSGVWLTKRDTFLTKAEYMQLVYSACSPTRPGLTDAANHLILPPTILKPEPLYTGKQVRCAVLCCAVLCCAALPNVGLTSVSDFKRTV